MGWLHLDWRVVLVSNNANNSSKAGSFALNANNTWSNANVNIASHLCLWYTKIIDKCSHLAPWQKIKKSLIQFGSLVSDRTTGGEISKLMKRHGFLFEKICDMENIALAHKNASKGKMHYKEVQMVNSEPEKYLNSIRSMLKEHSYRNSPYEVMTKKTDNGKVREIFKLPYFPDRIIHHAIIQVVEPIWFNSLIRDTYSSIKGRGIHDGVRRIKKALFDKENTQYCLKMDVKKFYPSIDNQILKQIIRRKIKDAELLWLLDEIIDSTHGVPIGNYLSQYFGNLYLSQLDHIIKSKAKHYFRYCDDMVVFHGDKQFLHQLKNEIETYLNQQLNLRLKQNWQVFPVDKQGVDFLGYRFFHKYTLLRKSIKQRFVTTMKRIVTKHQHMTVTAINSMMSYYGWFKYSNCKNLQNKYFDKQIAFIVKHLCLDNGITNPLSKIA